MSFWHRFCKQYTSETRFDERRKYLRLDANIPVQYSIIPKGKEEDLEQRRSYEADAKNVGGGGLLVEIPILTEQLLLTTHMIKIKFTLPEDEKTIEAIARIVCVEKPEHIEGFYLRLEFIKIASEDQKRLISYVRGKQRKR